MNKIDKSSKIPLYAQLMEILINQIENYMEENDQLDSEREICDKYGVSRTTVRQALDELEKQKYIYKVHGKGNFISSRRVKQDLIKVYSFTDEMRKLGKKPISKLLNFEIAEPDSKILRKLKLKENEIVYKITRIRIADDIPMIYEVTYLPYDKFNGITKKDLEENPMYEIFKNDFKVHITSAEEVLESISINKLESIYLDVSQGEPGLKIERTTYENKQVIEYTVSIARGDKFKYRVCLKN
ncbi:GntR family transcriptional regulator [Clostridium botulinum]|nr:GntR family transcriptional regulator [Clostridium botulinum]